MTCNTFSLVQCLVVAWLFLASPVIAQHRGGGGDGGNDESSTGGAAPGSDYECTMNMNGRGCNCCLCGNWRWSEKLTTPPGIYYDGILTITHRVSFSTAWPSPDDPSSEPCGNNDGAPKTYRYPATLFAGPPNTKNLDDPNGIHWWLRAYPPADHIPDIVARGPWIDTHTGWVSIRSSDFTNRDPELNRIADAWPHDSATSMSGLDRVFWETTLSHEGDNIFSARARLESLPPRRTDFLKPDSGAAEDYDAELPGTGHRSSQYILLSDVCAGGHGIDGRSRLTDSPLNRHARPTSLITGDIESENTTTPVLWFQEGAQANMIGIGASTATFSLNHSWNHVLPYLTWAGPDCHGDMGARARFEQQQFHAPRDPETGAPLNISVSVDLSFMGDMVRGNSSEILGQEADRPVFAVTYETLRRDALNTIYGGGGDNAGRTVLDTIVASLVLGAAATIALAMVA